MHSAVPRRVGQWGGSQRYLRPATVTGAAPIYHGAHDASGTQDGCWKA